MAIALVSSTTNSGFSSSPSVALPGGGSPGDLLIVFLSENTEVDSSDNNGATPMTKDVQTPNLSGGNSMAIYSRIISGGEGGTLSFTLATSQRWGLIAAIFSGWHGTTKYDTNPSGAAIGGSSCPGVTIKTPGSMAIAVVDMDGSADTFNSPLSSGWTDIGIVSTQQAIAAACKIVSAGSTGSIKISITGSSSSHYALPIFAIRPPTVKPTKSLSTLGIGT